MRLSRLMICLMGPTASGKTAIACDWVSCLPLEIISVDSAMIYQDMDIGTAKPSLDVLKKAPHHLINQCTPKTRYSAAQFCSDVWQISEAIWLRGRIPLLVGGTMMYFRALQQGLSVLPEADEAIRASLSEQTRLHGTPFLHDWLKRVDPISSERIHPQDTQRLQRALEVYLATNKPLSAYLADPIVPPQATFVNYGLFPQNRAWLHARIAQRFHAMLEEGFLDEVQHLISKWHVTQDDPSMRSVGYRQALDYLAGEIDYPTFVERGIAATRQLAKRQLTWLRHWPDIKLVDPEDTQSAMHLLHAVTALMA